MISNPVEQSGEPGTRLALAKSRAHPGFACQTYSWQMTPPPRRRTIDVIAGQIATAGFPAVEPEIVMLGAYVETAALVRLLNSARLSLAALCLVLDWRGPRETDAEMAAADAAIATVARMPGAILNLCQSPGPDENDRRERQRNLASCANLIGKRASDAGVATAFHPNSPRGSVFRIEDDYRNLMDDLDEIVGLCPDMGHIAMGDMDPVEIVRRYGRRVKHVHYKDMSADRKWARTGEGVVDFSAVTRQLLHARYTGWIVMEDESPAAERDPAAAAVNNADYARSMLAPLVAAAQGPQA